MLDAVRQLIVNVSRSLWSSTTLGSMRLRSLDVFVQHLGRHDL